MAGFTAFELMSNRRRRWGKYNRRHHRVSQPTSQQAWLSASHRLTHHGAYPTPHDNAPHQYLIFFHIIPFQPGLEGFFDRTAVSVGIAYTHYSAYACYTAPTSGSAAASPPRRARKLPTESTPDFIDGRPIPPYQDMVHVRISVCRDLYVPCRCSWFAGRTLGRVGIPKREACLHAWWDGLGS